MEHDGDNKPSRLLRTADLLVERDGNCTAVYEKKWFDLELGTDLCVGDPGNKKVAGSGDSGSPLVIREMDGTVTQIGIVSRGDPNHAFECLVDNSPDVYTNVAAFSEWIASATGMNLT